MCKANTELPCPLHVISSLRVPKILRLEIIFVIYDIKVCGERIRQLRIKSNLTQEGLASELNIDRSLLSHVEAGKRGCSVDLFVRLSEFFGVTLDLLILGKEQAASQDIDGKTALKSEIEVLVKQLEAFKKRL